MPTQNVTINDTDPRIVYNPAETFTTHSNVANTFGLVNNDDTFGNAYNSTITFAFYGTSIFFFGNLGDQHGNYTVTLDGKNPTVVSGYAATQQPPVVLYSARNLDLATQHQIQIRQSTPAMPNFMEIDSFIINTDPSINQPGTAGVTTAPVGQATAAAGSTGGSSAPLGAIIGGAVGGGVALLILIGLLVCCLRRRNRNRSDVPEFHDTPGSYDVETKAVHTPSGLQATPSISFASPTSPTSATSNRWEPSEIESVAPSSINALEATTPASATTPISPMSEPRRVSTASTAPAAAPTRPESTMSSVSGGFFALGEQRDVKNRADFEEEGTMRSSSAAANGQGSSSSASSSAGVGVTEAGPSRSMVAPMLETHDEELPPPAYS